MNKNWNKAAEHENKNSRKIPISTAYVIKYNVNVAKLVVV